MSRLARAPLVAASAAFAVIAVLALFRLVAIPLGWRWVGVAALAVILAILLLRGTSSSRVGALIAVGIGLVMRVLWIATVPTVPESDFLSYHQFAVAAATGAPAREVFPLVDPQHLGYPALLTLLYRCFGSHAMVGKVTNVVFGAALIWVVYRFARRVDERTARVAAALTAVWPAHIMMTSVLATELLYLPLVWSAVALSIGGVEGRLRPSAAAGVVLGISNWVRPTSLLVLLALSAHAAGSAAHPRRRRALLVLVLVGGFAAAQLVYSGVRFSLDDPITRAPVGFSLIMGTNLASEGRWNASDANWFLRQRSERGVEQANRDAIRLAFERLSLLGRDWPRFLDAKVSSMWADESYGVLWGLGALDSSDAGARAASWRDVLKGLSHVFYVIVLVAAAVSAWRVRQRISTPSLIAAVYVLGFLGSAHLLLEVQGRYHMPSEIVPFLFAASLRSQLSS